MKNKILQTIADNLIDNLETAIFRGDDKMLEYFFGVALWYEAFCLYVFGVELK
jgi:hypothetical protein